MALINYIHATHLSNELNDLDKYIKRCVTGHYTTGTFGEKCGYDAHKAAVRRTLTIMNKFQSSLYNITNVTAMIKYLILHKFKFLAQRAKTKGNNYGIKKEA